MYPKQYLFDELDRRSHIQCPVYDYAYCGICCCWLSGEIEILLDLDNQKTVKLKDLIPDWWGTHKFTE